MQEQAFEDVLRYEPVGINGHRVPRVYPAVIQVDDTDGIIVRFFAASSMQDPHQAGGRTGGSHYPLTEDQARFLRDALTDELGE